MQQYEYVDPDDPQNMNPDGTHNGGFFSIEDNEAEFDRKCEAETKRLCDELTSQLKIIHIDRSHSYVLIRHLETDEYVCFRPHLDKEDGKTLKLVMRPSDWVVCFDQHNLTYQDQVFERQFNIHRDLVSSYCYYTVISDWIIEQLNKET